MQFKAVAVGLAVIASKLLKYLMCAHAVNVCRALVEYANTFCVRATFFVFPTKNVRVTNAGMLPVPALIFE